LFLKDGAAEIAAWGGGEFELLIVNPVPAGTLEFQERVTKEEVSPKAGQRPGKLML
jgi:hypothetical protein